MSLLEMIFTRARGARLTLAYTARDEIHNAAVTLRELLIQ